MAGLKEKLVATNKTVDLLYQSLNILEMAGVTGLAARVADVLAEAIETARRIKDDLEEVEDRA